MSEKLIVSIGLSPVVQKEIIDGHILTMQQRLFGNSSCKLRKAMYKKGIVTGAATFLLQR